VAPQSPVSQQQCPPGRAARVQRYLRVAQLCSADGRRGAAGRLLTLCKRDGDFEAADWGLFPLCFQSGFRRK